MLDRLARTLGANRIVLALSFARLVDALGNSILFVIIPLYVGTMATALPLPEPVLVGALISFFGFVNAGAQPLLGALVDRTGHRKAFIVGGLGIMAAGTLSFVFATRYAHLFAIRTLQGVGVAMTIPSSLALMAAATEQRTRGGSMGVYTSFRMVGIALGPILGGFLHDRYGFDPAFYVATFLILAGLVLVQLWVEEPAGEPQGSEDGPPPRPFRIVDFDLLTPAILGIGFAIFVMATTITMMATLEREFNLRLEQTTFAFGIAFSSLMISRLAVQTPLGWLSDRIGRKPLVVSGLILLAPSTALLGHAASTMQLTLWRVVQGVASGAIAAPGYALAADVVEVGGEGRQMSFVTMGFGLGIAVGPLLAGVLAVGFFALPFWVGGALCLVGAAVVGRWVPESLEA